MHGWCVPRTTHHSDAVEPSALRLTNGATHVRLTLLLTQLACAIERGVCSVTAHRLAARIDLQPQLGHRGRYCREQPRIVVAAMLDELLPETLAIVIPGGRREPAERVVGREDRGRWFVRVGCSGRLGHLTRIGRLVIRLVLGRVDQLVRQREIDEPRRDAPVDGVPHRAPLRRELGKGVVHRSPRRIGPIDEDRDGRTHLVVARESNQLVRLGRTLDEDDVRLEAREGPLQAARRAGPVMADTEHVNVGCRFGLLRA